MTQIITILGVTASGKTNLAVELAKKFNGEVVSADSRQIYKEFNIGTAKPKGQWSNGIFVVDGVPHYLIDFVEPQKDYTLVDYKRVAIDKIGEIFRRGKIPFLVGGTALYLKAVLENWDIPEAAPNIDFRKKIEEKTADELYLELLAKDPEAAVITGAKNKRRIVRALEVIYETGRKFSEQRKTGQPLFDCLKLGLKIPQEELKTRIENRTDEMFAQGLLDEVKKLSQKYAWESVPMQSIGYQEFKDYFEDEAPQFHKNKRNPPKPNTLLRQGYGGLSASDLLLKPIGIAKADKKTLAETRELIIKHSLDYAKRQMTWFKKDKTINWVPANLKLALTESSKLVQDFLKN